MLSTIVLVVLAQVAPVPVVKPLEDVEELRRRKEFNDEFNRHVPAGLLLGLEKTDELLVARRWTEADRAAERMVRDLRDGVIGGSGEADWFGRALAQRAVARAGLGDQRMAEWWWRSALHFWPDASDIGLERFGDAGSLLAGIGLPPAPGAASSVSELDADMIPPRLRHRVDPKPPRRLKRSQADEVVVESVVAEDGRLERPQVRQGSQVPAVTVACLEVLPQWRYEPARRGSEPVAASLVIRIETSRGRR